MQLIPLKPEEMKDMANIVDGVPEPIDMNLDTEKCQKICRKIRISRQSSVFTLNRHPPVGPVPVTVMCPHCECYQLTDMVWAITMRTHFAPLMCCVLGLWCLIPIPYINKSFKHAFHYCRLCHEYIESYPAQ